MMKRKNDRRKKENMLKVLLNRTHCYSPERKRNHNEIGAA